MGSKAGGISTGRLLHSSSVIESQGQQAYLSLKGSSYSMCRCEEVLHILPHYAKVVRAPCSDVLTMWADSHWRESAHPWKLNNFSPETGGRTSVIRILWGTFNPPASWIIHGFLDSTNFTTCCTFFFPTSRLYRMAKVLISATRLLSNWKNISQGGVVWI